ncbi:MAG TPA: hypothetical protein ENJ82_06735, partial [Bacteroidetes bacterium]|nr:hypothetical protein [Bacteroidota bacterium]
MKHLLMLLIVLALHNLAYSANIIWTNANANNSWNDPQNWSSGTVPGSADIAIFDGSSTANCNLGVNLNVLGFRINAGYTGTITQNVGTYITVGNSDFVQAAGVFLGGNSKIDINGNYTLNGGIFTSTSDLLQVKNDFTFTGGTFGHNSGTVFFDGNTQNVTGSLTFSNVTLNLAWGGGNWIINNNININGALSIGGDQDTDIEGTGLINCLGNINLSNTHYGGGTGTINISGSSNQSVFGAAPVNRCALPHVIINKSGGQVTFSGTTTVFGNWTYIAGSTDYSTNNSTILLNGRNRQITGIQTFQNLSFFTAWGGGAFDFMDDVTIKSKLTIQGAQATHLNGPGRVNCEGDIDLVGNMTGNNGNAVIHIIGNANQLIRGHNNIGWCELPNITINKSGGIATFDNTVSLTRDWTYTAGTIDYLANNAVIGFTGSNQAINGVQDFENLHVLLSWGGGDLNVMNNITVKRKFTISGNQNTDLNGPGLVNCIGDIDLLGNMTGNNGNAIVNITGTANQLITGHINLGWCELPNVTINKSGGIATFANTVSLVRNWTYTAGTVDHISQNSTIAFTGINQVINGVQDFENLHLRLAWGGGDVDVMDNITVK